MKTRHLVTLGILLSMMIAVSVFFMVRLLKSDISGKDKHGLTVRTEVSSSEEEDAVIETDTIKIESPQKDEIIDSPLEIRGLARGSWFFEGVFTAELMDENGVMIARSNVIAQGEWMTDDFVPFHLSMVFDRKKAKSGVLILSKSNPSGLAANEESLTVPLRFK